MFRWSYFNFFLLRNDRKIDKFFNVCYIFNGWYIFYIFLKVFVRDDFIMEIIESFEIINNCFLFFFYLYIGFLYEI